MSRTEFEETVPTSAAESQTTQIPTPAYEPHNLERAVRRRLISEPGFEFSSLVVRRLNDGVVLEGVLEADADLDDIDRLAGAVEGVNRVLNRLVIKRPAPKG